MTDSGPSPSSASDPAEAPTVFARSAAAEAPRRVASPGARAGGGWRWWQLVGFRYLLCHFLLYAWPSPFADFFATLGNGIRSVAWRMDWQWLRDAPFTWPEEVAQWLQATATWWQSAATWLDERGWSPLQVIVQPTGSGDTAAAYIQLGLIVAASLLITVVWSWLAKRSSGYPRAGRWLHVLARWYLSFVLIGYGLHKVYTGQFGTMSWGRLTQEVGDKSPMGMVWLFMAASRPYELFGAIGEVVGGVLLFHHRTALLGCFVSIAVMANVCALNWLYDVPVKLFSTHLLLIAVCLLAPHGARLWALLVSNRPSDAVDLRVAQRPWLQRSLAIVGWSWALAHLVTAHFTHAQAMRMRAEQLGPQPALYGLWDVEKMVRDGVEVPIVDATRWRFVAIDHGPRLWWRDATGKQVAWQLQEDLANQQLTVKLEAKDASSDSLGAAGAATWQVQLGTKLVKVKDPEPVRFEKRNELVDVQRRTLVLTGALDGKPFELHTVERQFPIQRGLHFVQEIPFHR